MDRVGSWWDICPRVASYSGQWALGAVTKTPGSQRNVSWGAVQALLLRCSGVPCLYRICQAPSHLSLQILLQTQ